IKNYYLILLVSKMLDYLSYLKTYVVYLDNILIYSKNKANYKRHMREVLERLYK
ncbi:hypothetical protein K458DRAFT_323299, partial [Lentithecium fluviatile CBS 122367]